MFFFSKFFKQLKMTIIYNGLDIVLWVDWSVLLHLFKVLLVDYSVILNFIEVIYLRLDWEQKGFKEYQWDQLQIAWLNTYCNLSGLLACSQLLHCIHLNDHCIFFQNLMRLVSVHV